jgi:anti-sigma B factor antagonist
MLNIKTRYAEQATVLELSGRFDKYAANVVSRWFEQNIGAESANIIVNLASVSFIDSTALATLMQAMKRCSVRGGKLSLCGLQQPVYMIFELTRLEKAFSIFVDEQHAIQALAS